MAYADSIRTTTIGTADIATLIEGLLVTSAYDGGESLGLSTTSATLVQLGAKQITLTAPSGARVLVIGSASFSHSVNGKFIVTYLSEDSTSVGSGMRGIFKEGNANTNGYNTTIIAAHIFSPAAGAHTYRMLWSTDAATAYCDSLAIRGIVLRA
jgi:hypothetical protein